MNITLPSQLEAFVRAKVESGRYSDASDVVVEALRVLERKEQLERLRAEIQIGIQAIDEGRTVADTPALRRALKEEAIRRAKAGVKISDAIKP
jgi:antitoxin ParD1/3/4